MIQLIFGWPGIITFIAVATMAAWLPSFKLMFVALVLCAPSSLYLAGGNGWIQLVAVYVPISVLGAALLLKAGRSRLPKLLLLPTYAFYVYLGSAVFNQSI